MPVFVIRKVKMFRYLSFFFSNQKSHIYKYYYMKLKPIDRLSFNAIYRVIPAMEVSQFGLLKPLTSAIGGCGGRGSGVRAEADRQSWA